jgi:hypothetical protein
LPTLVCVVADTPIENRTRLDQRLVVVGDFGQVDLSLFVRSLAGEIDEAGSKRILPHVLHYTFPPL